MSRLISLIATALLLAACGAPVAAGDPITVAEPWARAAAAGGTSAVYARVDNGGQADALIGAASDVAEAVEIHETTMEDNVMRMRPVPSLAIPAGGSVELKPGGIHVMLMGLRRDLRAGETISLTLRFERAGELAVTVPVREP